MNEKQQEKTNRHKMLCNFIHEMYRRKNHDYGDSFHQSYVEEGIVTARFRIGDKFNRFKQLSKNPDSQQVKDESIKDTLLDLANYAIMTVLEIQDAEDAAENGDEGDDYFRDTV